MRSCFFPESPTTAPKTSFSFSGGNTISQSYFSSYSPPPSPPGPHHHPVHPASPGDWNASQDLQNAKINVSTRVAGGVVIDTSSFIAAESNVLMTSLSVSKDAALSFGLAPAAPMGERKGGVELSEAVHDEIMTALEERM